MMRGLNLALGLIGWAFAGSAPAAADQVVDLELVLAGDGSGSIEPEEMALQRQGYAAAIADPQVLALIQSGPVGAIALQYIEWGGSFSQDIVVDWMIVHDLATAQEFAARLLAAPRRTNGFNSIGGAIRFAQRQIETNAFEGERLTIDVSGDGPDVGAPPAEVARDEAVAAGIVINALAIETTNPSAYVSPIPLARYYEARVIGGPGAFVAVADGMESFRDALLAKLLREIAANPASQTDLAEAGEPARP